MRRNDTCPACHAINPDNWKICCKCSAPRPAKLVKVREVAIGNGTTHAPRQLPLLLNHKEVVHLLFALRGLIIHSSVIKGERPDTFWRRNTGLLRRLRKMEGAK